MSQTHLGHNLRPVSQASEPTHVSPLTIRSRTVYAEGYKIVDFLEGPSP